MTPQEREEEHITSSQYHPVDIEITGRCDLENPFFAEVKGVFEGPDGERLCIPGFYDGDGTWKVRFSPVALGMWDYRLYSPHVDIEKRTGRILCVQNENPRIHGGLRVDPDFPHHFRFEDGTHHFMMGYEADWLWALGLGDPEIEEVREFIDTIGKYGFNQVIMNIYAHDTSWCRGKTCDRDFGPPPCYAWEGSNEAPDHARLNVEFFRNYDRVVAYMCECGIMAHLMFKVYNKGVNWPEEYSPEEDLYFRYITARYQAFPNIIWDFSKETWRVSDKAYIEDRLNIIRSCDGYHRLATTHDDRTFYAAEHWARNLDFLTAQEGRELYALVLLERERLNWPILNAEFGYECGPKGKNDLTFPFGQTAEELVQMAYEIVMAGGYPAYYYTHTAWDVIDHSHIPKGYQYFRILRDFFTSIEWWRLEPELALNIYGRCLARPGEEYVIYGTRPVIRHDYLELKDQKFDCTWMNIYTGEQVKSNEGITRLNDALSEDPLIAGPPLRTARAEANEGVTRRSDFGYRFALQSPFQDAPWILHIRIRG